VVELHGSLTRTYCIDCGADAAEADLAGGDGAGYGEPARCRACGGYLRPGVVWFGEALPEAALAEAYAAAERADVFLSVGTSAVVYPAALLPVYAREQGAYVAEVNVEPSAIPPAVDEVVPGPAGTALPALVETLTQRRTDGQPATRTTGFAHPELLALLALVLLVGVWEWWRARRRAGLRFSNVAPAKAAPPTLWARLRGLPAGLRLAALTLGIVALARPQDRNTVQERYAEGVDIMLVLDTSTSMRAQDFQPNRFEAARDVAAEFIRGRLSDRIGLIVFAAQAFTQTPLTLDYAFLLRMLGEVETGMIEDGTAIGTALATAVSRLKDSTAESKVVILLTDGQNNRGEIDPVTASDVAQAMGVRIYSIGVGAHGEAPFLFDDPFVGQR